MNDLFLVVRCWYKVVYLKTEGLCSCCEGWLYTFGQLAVDLTLHILSVVPGDGPVGDDVIGMWIAYGVEERDLDGRLLKIELALFAIFGSVWWHALLTFAQWDVQTLSTTHTDRMFESYHLAILHKDTPISND